MSQRTEVRHTDRIPVIDQYGQRHLISEYTDYLYVQDLGGRNAPPIPGLKQYSLQGRFVNKHDDDTFELPDGTLRFTRV